MENNPLAGSGRGNNFFSGFLLGALVGAGIVFLFGTKRGKRILKAISEKGLDNISNLLEEANQVGSLEEFAEDDEPAKVKKIISRQFVVKEAIEEKPKVRRFFRGISRHLN